MPTYACNYTSPAGPLALCCNDTALLSIDAGKTDRTDDHPLLRRAAAALDAYFAGTLKAFDLPLAPAGTPFQLRVWEELKKVPYGTTVTYGALAKRIDCGSAQAVGQAVGRNPLLILVPCHRVVAANGIGGFSCGLAVKKALMSAENIKY